MSGHSKWAGIKHKKAILDARRGKLFAKLLRAIDVAAREGGPNIDANATLASAVQKAKDYSVPLDNIERAIKRASGDTEGARFEPIVYEGYGPGGVAILVEALTDNRNRTGQEVRHTFTKMGGNLGDPGSVAWQFDRKGSVLIAVDDAPEEEQILELVLDAGAEDLRREGDQWHITTEATSLQAVRSALESSNIAIAAAELTMNPQTMVPLEGSEAKRVLALIDALDDLDDVQAVYANFDIPDEVLAEAG